MGISFGKDGRWICMEKYARRLCFCCYQNIFIFNHFSFQWDIFILALTLVTYFHRWDKRNKREAIQSWLEFTLWLHEYFIELVENGIMAGLFALLHVGQFMLSRKLCMAIHKTNAVVYEGLFHLYKSFCYF